MPTKKTAAKDAANKVHRTRMAIANVLGIMDMARDGEVDLDELEAIQATRDSIDEIADEYAIGVEKIDAGIAGIEDRISRLKSEMEFLKTKRAKVDESFVGLCTMAGVDLMTEVVGSKFKITKALNPPSVKIEDEVSAYAAKFQIEVTATVRIGAEEVARLGGISEEKIASVMIAPGEVFEMELAKNGNPRLMSAVTAVVKDVMSATLDETATTDAIFKAGMPTKALVRASKKIDQIDDNEYPDDMTVTRKMTVVTVPKKEILSSFKENGQELPGITVFQNSRIVVKTNC